MRQEYPCAVCGNLVLRYPSDLYARGRSGRVVCSRACQTAWQKQSQINTGTNNPRWKGNHISVTCEVCGVGFAIKPTQFRRFTHRFCSRACKGRWNSLNKSAENSPTWKGVTAERPCDVCGTMYRPHSQGRKRREQQIAHLCSPTCKHAWMSGHSTSVPPTMVREQHWAWKGASAERPCDECGQVFRPRSRPKNKHFFCSRACSARFYSKHLSGPAHPKWQGGSVRYYGPNWNAQKRAARKRDGYKCRACGKAQKKHGCALDVHHIKPFRTFGYILGVNDNYLQANDLANLVSLCRRCHLLAEHHKIAIQPYLL